MFWNIGGNSITLQSFEAEVQRKCEVSKGKSTAWICPNGGIGRRVGLKIQCPLKTCRFEPGFGHPTEVSLVFFGRLLLFLSDSTLRLLPSTFGRRKRAEVSLKRAVLHPWATKMYESVAQGSRAAPSGDEDVRKCCPRESCCTLGRRRCTKVSLKRAVLHPRATKMYESVAQARRAAHSGNEDIRKCRSSVPCCTLGRR